MSRDQAWKGVAYCVGNARQLLEGASQLAKGQFFGQAAAMAVLSAEESSKALGLFGRAIDPIDEEVSLRPFFRDHAFKHHSASFAIVMTSIFNDVMEDIIAIQNDSNIPESEYGGELVRRSTRRLRSYVETDSDPFDGVSEWKTKANRVKQRGLYVDFKNEKWKSPADVDRQEYEEMAKIADYLLGALEPIVQNGEIEEIRAIVRHQFEDIKC